MRPRQKGARPPSQGRQRVSRGRTGWHLGQQTGQTGGPIQGRHLVGLSDASLNVPASSRANWRNVFARAPDIRTSPRTSADTGVRLSRAATGTVRRRQRDCPDCQEGLSRGVLMLGFRTFTFPELPMHCADAVLVSRSTCESLLVAEAGGLPPNHCGLSWSRRRAGSRATRHRLVAPTWRISAQPRPRRLDANQGGSEHAA